MQHHQGSNRIPSDLCEVGKKTVAASEEEAAMTTVSTLEVPVEI